MDETLCGRHGCPVHSDNVVMLNEACVRMHVRLMQFIVAVVQLW